MKRRLCDARGGVELKMGWRRDGTKGKWETYVTEARGVGIRHVDDVDEAGCMHWKQVDKGRAIGEGGRKGLRVEGKDLELQPKKKLPVAWISQTALESPGLSGGYSMTCVRSCFVCSCISIDPETCDLLDKVLSCNSQDMITASYALDHDYLWTDPLTADPKT